MLLEIIFFTKIIKFFNFKKEIIKMYKKESENDSIKTEASRQYLHTFSKEDKKPFIQRQQADAVNE